MDSRAMRAENNFFERGDSEGCLPLKVPMCTSAWSQGLSLKFAKIFHIIYFEVIFQYPTLKVNICEGSDQFHFTIMRSSWFQVSVYMNHPTHINWEQAYFFWISIFVTGTHFWIIRFSARILKIIIFVTQNLTTQMFWYERKFTIKM